MGHVTIRKNVIKHAIEFKHIFEPLCDNNNLIEYIRESKMSEDGTWATEFEICVTSHFIKMNVNVHSNQRWQFFKTNFLDDERECPGNINLTLENSHFEVILRTSRHYTTIPRVNGEHNSTSRDCIKTTTPRADVEHNS